LKLQPSPGPSDDTLRTMADRIQARAIKRCGELLRAIKEHQGGRPKLGAAAPQVSRSQAVRDAGLSRDQKRDALRVARIPDADFERAVERARDLRLRLDAEFQVPEIPAGQLNQPARAIRFRVGCCNR
jgi:hypothetical protein